MMEPRWGGGVALALSALLGACVAPAPLSFAPGSSLASVEQALGPPTAEYALPQGARELEYATGPYGKSTYMLVFDSAGRLGRAEQVLTEAHFNEIRPGMRSDEVLRRLGRPSEVWPLAHQRQQVWSYRYPTYECRWFMIGMGLDGTVADTGYGEDPLCAVHQVRRAGRGAGATAASYQSIKPSSLIRAMT